MADTLYQVAKAHGIKPQQLYNLARVGIIKTRTVQCDLGFDHKVADEASVQEYLTKRAERQAAAAAKVKSELESS